GNTGLRPFSLLKPGKPPPPPSLSVSRMPPQGSTSLSLQLGENRILYWSIPPGCLLAISGSGNVHAVSRGCKQQIIPILLRLRPSCLPGRSADVRSPEVHVSNDWMDCAT